MKQAAGIMMFLFASIAVQAQEADRHIQRGNELYRQQQYPQAELAYAEALVSEPNNATAKFNRANTLYKLNKPDEAIRVLNDLAFKSNDAAVKSKAYYNKGAILSSQKKLEESIDAYKESLRQDPSDKDARENLQKALLELKKKNQSQQKQDNKKQQKQQQQQQKPQPKMSQKEAEQRLQLLEQKEKDVQQRLQQEKSKQGGGQGKDW
jgi:Ca-activated chloride channel homolog